MDLPITLSRCPLFTNGDIDTDRPIPVVPKSHDCALTKKQLVDYNALLWEIVDTAMIV